MVKSRFVTASAGSGKTYCLTEEIRSHLDREGEFVVAATFTKAAAAEMEKRILEQIEKGDECPAEKLRLIMRASRAHFSTIDALFHRFLSTEAYLPQVADEHEQALITEAAGLRFFQDPRVLADLERIVIAARILRLRRMPESLLGELDKGRETLAAWDCSEERLGELIAGQARIAAEYGKMQERVRAVAAATQGVLEKQVVEPLLQPLASLDLSRALFTKRDLAEVRMGKDQRETPAYATLQKLYPRMRRLVAEHLLNSKRLRSALLKRFSSLRAEVLDQEKERLGRLYFADIPAKLLSLDGPESLDRPHFMARLYELGFYRTNHLLLDEFQDTSRIQYDLLRPLIDEILGSVGEDAEGARSLFLVGDWKQSIYQWRDAAPDYLRERVGPFLASGQLAPDILPHNYRSTPLLITFFNHLVEELFDDPDKVNLQTPPEEPRRPYAGVSEVAVIPAACDKGDEAVYVRLVEAIREKQAACGCDWGDMTVLCRTNGHQDKIAAALAKSGISTSGVRGRELLALREGTALWLALIAAFTGHNGDFIPRGLAALGYGEELSAIITRVTAAAANAPRPQQFAALATALRSLAPLFPPVLVETIWDEAERYFDRSDAGDVAGFLSYLLEMSYLITVPEGEHAGRVKLATIHSTKGLEFPHVFLFWKKESERAPEILHPDDGCPLSLNKDEIAFLATDPIPGGGVFAEAAAAVKEEKAEETANLLYVAATRSVKSLTILLRADKEGDVGEGFGKRMLRAAGKPISDAERTTFGWRYDYGPEKPAPADSEELPPPVIAESTAGPEPEKEMDPALRSADIEAGIERGLRIHAALARLTEGRRTVGPAGLTKEDLSAVEQFLAESKIREILFRPGKVLVEQHLSDTRSVGIVDRLILAEDRITLIDFKTGRVGHLAEKYRLQMLRYRTILQGLFPNRSIDGYLLFVDEPHHIVAVPQSFDPS
ncbi:MAG: UvrD-helicase domain-containing protein [Syntrophaceae bacterium]|nr:UvrD-helicase domain-containing protein [Syntrophaceae bacterium]